MNIYEKIYKLFLELFIFLIFFIIYSSFMNHTISLLSGILTAHTLVWLFNGHVMTMFIHMGLLPNKPKKFIEYTDRLYYRVLTKKYIGGAAVFGSLTRYNFKKTSDLDIRIIMKKGFWNRFLICHFCFIERSRAFFMIYPMDIFAFELEELKNKMSRHENPVIFSDMDGILCSFYPQAYHYKEFSDEFRSRFV